MSTRGWEVDSARGSGQVELRPGTGTGLKPTGAAGLRLQGRTLVVAGAHVEARGARVTADGELRRDGALSGRFTAELPLAAVPGLLADVGRPATTPPVEGRLVAEGTVAGRSTAPEVSARVSGDLAVRDDTVALEAQALYREGRLAVAPLVLRSGRGQATLHGTVPLGPADAWDLAGDVDALDVAPGLALAGVDGSGPATGTVQVSGPRDEPRVRASLRAEARLRRPASADGVAGVEDDVVLQLDGQSVGRRVELERVEAQLAGGRVSGTARYDAASGQLAANLEASDLAWERLPLLPEPARRIAGTLAGKLALAGRTSAPEGELDLTLAEPQLDGAPLPPLAVTTRADGRELRMALTSDAVEVVTGRGPLEGDWPLRLVVDAKALPYAALVGAFPAVKQAGAELAGSGSLTLELPLRAPERLKYQGSDLAFSGRLRRLEWRTRPFSLEGDRETLQVSDLRLEAGKAWIAVHGRAGLEGGSPFDLEVESSLDFESLSPALALRAVAGRGAPVRTFAGTGSLKLRVEGTREAPRLSGSLQLVDVRGRVEGARVTDLDAEARFEGRELRVERLQASLLGGTATASGAIPLFGARGATSRLVFGLKDLDLAQFLDRELRESADSPSLLVSLDGDVQAEGPSLARVSASGRLTRLDSRSVEGALALAAPVAWSLERGRFTIDPIRLEGALGKLEARLSGDAGEGGTKGEAVLSGAVDLRALSPFLPDTTVSGPATIDLRAD